MNFLGPLDSVDKIILLLDMFGIFAVLGERINDRLSRRLPQIEAVEGILDTTIDKAGAVRELAAQALADDKIDEQEMKAFVKLVAKISAETPVE